MNKLLPSMALLALPLQADVITPAQRFFGMGGQLPAFDSREEGVYSEADSDLGVQEILAERSGRDPVLVEFSKAFYRTDNAPARDGMTDESSWLLAARLNVAWRPHLTNGWFGDFGLAQDFLFFDRSSATDYENTGLRLGVMKTIPELDDLIVYGRYEYQRLTTGSFSDSDYLAQRLRIGVQKQVLSGVRHDITLGGSTAWEFSTKPSSVERNEFTIEAAHRFRISDNMHTLASWRTSAFDFSEGGRDDWSHGLALQWVWQFCPSARMHVSVFYDQNDSDSAFGANDYKSWTGGIGTGLNLTF